VSAANVAIQSPGIFIDAQQQRYRRYMHHIHHGAAAAAAVQNPAPSFLSSCYYY
jgi:hypothetical protein